MEKQAKDEERGRIGREINEVIHRYTKEEFTLLAEVYKKQKEEQEKLSPPVCVNRFGFDKKESTGSAKKQKLFQ